MSKQEYSPIDELNKENEWRFWKPFIQAFGGLIIVFPLVYVILLFADFIDYLFRSYTVQFAFILVVGSLALIVRREIKRF